MSDDVLDFLREQFRRVNARFDAMDDRLSGLELRMHVQEDHMAAVVVAISGVNQRLDRLQRDVDMIKRRLELVEAE